MNQSNVCFAVVLGCLMAGSSFAQQVISAKSGLINYTEGQVFLGDSLLKHKFGEYPDIKTGQHLRTEEGRAEVLLTPGVFLRLAENSEIGMVANALSDTRIEVLKGAVVIEANEVSKEIGVEFLVSGSRVDLRKPGVFRIDASDPPRIRAYDGEISLVQDGQQTVVKEGRQMLLTSVPVAEKFSKDDTDPFFRWAARRSGYVAAANLSAAHYLREQNYSLGSGSWFYSPYMGLFTYIPVHGFYRNMWNYAYYSPSRVYETAPSWGGGGYRGNDGFSGMSAGRGMADMSGRSYGGGMSGGGVYQAPATSAPAASAPSAGRAGGGGSAGASRGGSSGGR